MDKEPVVCGAKHTKYQPTNEEWRCPKCGATADQGFNIDSPDPESSDDCELNHDLDEIHCNRCHEYSAWGKGFAAALQKKHNLGPCSQCKGAGMVNKDKGNVFELALRKILAIENKSDGGDWDEIEEARATAAKALKVKHV